MSSTRRFTIVPRGAFSLREANAFEFGPRDASDGDRMALAFALDGTGAPVGVELTQDASTGAVHAEVQGEGNLDVVEAQVARVLSLDHDGKAWAKVLDAEPPLATLAARMPGLRPVLFHSPYEAAAWSIISARVQRAQAARIRDQLAADLGTTYQLHGEAMHAFPAPAALLRTLEGWDGPLPERKREWLVGVARAADEGLLDAAGLRQAGPEETAARVQQLAGIGPFYASLIAWRATGFADAEVHEPRARAAALTAYGRPQSTDRPGWLALQDRWRPFRIWATVLCRAAEYRGELTGPPARSTA